MFDRLKKLFSASPASDEAENGREKAVSIAALLVEAALADETYAADERALIGKLLANEFGVEPADVASVLAEAETRQREAVDLYRFIKEVKALTPAEKITLIEALWRVVLSDGEKDAFEDMLVRRVCGLIHVSDVDSGLARQRVRQTISR
ncbi:MAG: TerB family tellurite resistance protein [Parvularculaceae bacterium]|nr:TerB family tellurite resistance protein [Parvularculaceae bacterium]